MKLIELRNKIRTTLKSNNVLILTGASVAGVVATAYLAGRASYKAANLIRDHELDGELTQINKKERIKERVKLVWTLYIPPAISTVATVTCIVCANRVETRKTLAAQAAFAVSERAYSEYRDRVIEEFGSRKDQAIRDKMAEDQVRENPPPSREVMYTGPGVVLCCELYTGRYFTSDMETLRRAQNTINASVLHDNYSTLTDFYHLVGLEKTQESGNMGWDSDKLMELSFSPILTPDDRPCIAFSYNYVKTL